MHKAIKNVLALTFVVSAIASLTACVSFGQDPIDCAAGAKSSKVPAVNQVSVILAPTDNFTNFETVFKDLEPKIRAAIGNQPAEVNVVIADGRPKSVLRMSSDATGEDGEVKNKHLVAKIANAYYCVIATEGHPVSSSIQLTDESDLIMALGRAAVPFENNATSKKTIFVFGNGLQTAGQISFADQGIPSESAANQLASKLKTQNALPDLFEADVNWTGLGQLSQDQDPLNEQSLKGLKAFWSAVISASNGVVGKLEGEGVTGVPASGSIHVSKVIGLPKACVSTSLSEQDGFNFSPGSAIFVNVSKALSGAKKIAAELSAKPNCTGSITVTGFVASASPKKEYVFGNTKDAALSLARAQAFKSLLVQAGVRVPITAVGGGKGPEIDWDAAGNYVETKGQLNRKVTIVQQ